MADRLVDSVSDLARGAGASSEFVQELEVHLAERSLVDHLLALRGAKGLSQKISQTTANAHRARFLSLKMELTETLGLGIR